MTTEMNDEELLGYAMIHSRTDLALFHRGHVKRLLELAGRPVPEMIDAREFWSLDWEVVEPLVKEARERRNA
jgi:hypothetical protein